MLGAASEVGLNESMEVTPIPRSSSSPSILHNPLQVMSPNAVSGSASTDPPPVREMETEAGVQAILQQWAEVKTEHGTVERRYTQCAQLASNVKLENMESVIHLLRQACDYLYDGVTQMGSTMDQKRDTEKVQQVVSEILMQLYKMKAMVDEKYKRVETIATRVDELSGESMNVRTENG